MTKTIYAPSREEIEAFAKNAGAPPASIRKWRLRGIPPAWHARIIKQSRGAVTLAHLLPLSSISIDGNVRIRS